MKTKNIKIGAIITYVQLFLNIIISIVCTPIILKILGPGEHGIYATVSSAVSFLSLLSLGVGSSYIRFYSKYKASKEDEKVDRLNGLFLIIFMVIGFAALLGGVLLSFNLNLLFDEGLTASDYDLARILSLIVTLDLAISFPASVFNSIIRADERYIWIKSINMLQSVLSPILTIPMLLMGFGSIGMVLITTIVDIVAYLLNIVFAFAKLKTKFKFKAPEKNILKSIFGFSIFIAINSIINQINSSLDKVLLARLVSPESVSVYAIGFSLYNYYGAFSTAISSLFTPSVHRTVSENENDRIQMKNRLTPIFVKLGRLQIMLQALLLTGIIFFGQAFISFWAGEGYENSFYVALILCCAYTVPLCQNIGVEIQRAQNKHYTRTVVYAVMTVLNIILTVILCPHFGEVGAVIGTAIAVVCVEIIFMNIYYHTKLNIDIKKFWINMLSISKGFIIPIAAGIAINYFIKIESILMLAVWIGVYSIVYAASVWFLSMNKEEHELLLGKILKVVRKK